MGKTDDYRVALGKLTDWRAYLAEHSGLPGPRANLELVRAVADSGDLHLFNTYVRSDDEFTALCGAVGLGRIAAEGDAQVLKRLRKLASDPRWRVREGVAMGLQRIGDADPNRLIREMEVWASGNQLEQRAAIAALCEPRLLSDPKHIRRVLALLNAVTERLAGTKERKNEEVIVLRKALAYCWSVAAAALPDEGRRSFDRWLRSQDPDVRWVMKQNLGKARMSKLGAAWLAERKAQLEIATS